MSTEVRHNPDEQRYELVDGDDVVGFADYTPQGDDVLVFPHTVIVPSRRGRGLGAVLVRGALDDVRRSGKKVVPSCWFVAEFIGIHPEYEDLVA